MSIIIGMSAAVPLSVEWRPLFTRGGLVNATWKQILTAYVTGVGNLPKISYDDIWRECYSKRFASTDRPCCLAANQLNGHLNPVEKPHDEFE